MNNTTDYFSHPALSQSKLKELKRTPLRFWSIHLDPARESQVDTPALILGKATHCYLFEREKFDSLYYTSAKINRQTIAGKIEYARVITSNLGKTLLSDVDFYLIKRMVDNIHRKNSVKVLLKDGIAEKELFWTDKSTGLECKAKLDFFIEPCTKYPYGVIIDLKTIEVALKELCMISMYKYGYYNQASFYCEAVKQIYQTKENPLFISIFAEKTVPYDCQFFHVDDGTLDAGFQQNQKLMLQYKECLEKNVWEGYKDEIQTIGLPHWAFNKVSENLEE